MKESKVAEGNNVKEGSGKEGSGKEGKEKVPPTELSQLLSKIGAASKVLNGAAHDASRRIEAVEQSLLDAEPGISVWSTTLLNEKATYQREDGSASEPAQRLVTLGFARVKKDKWGICVREELKVEKGSVYEDVSLLRKSDRNLRILAVPHLEQLTREVLAVLEQQITVLDSTREVERAREVEKAREAAKAAPLAPEAEPATTVGANA